MPPVILYALIALLLWGFWGFCSKLAADELKPRYALFYEIAGEMVVGAIAVAVLTVPDVTGRPIPALLAAVAGAALIGGIYLQFYALRLGKSGTVIAVTSLYPVLVTAFYPVAVLIFGAAFFEYTVTILDGIGITLALLSIYLIVGVER